MTLKNTQQETLQLTNEQTTMAHARLIDECVALLSYQHEEPLRWPFTLTDLIEVASMAYVSDMIVDDEGNNCTFILLVKSLCNCFGLRVPRNPWCYLQRIHMRKNMRSRAFFDRYCWLMYKMGQSHPLLLSVHLPTGLCTSAFE